MADGSIRDGWACDPEMLRQASSTTFVYGPRLDVRVHVPVVHALKPNLYLGIDLIAPIRSPTFVGHPSRLAQSLILFSLYD